VINTKAFVERFNLQTYQPVNRQSQCVDGRQIGHDLRVEMLTVCDPYLTKAILRVSVYVVTYLFLFWLWLIDKPSWWNWKNNYGPVYTWY